MSNQVLISTEYILVIDTNSFSERFAKELCAYCTGFIDESDKGEKFADLFYLDQGIADDEFPKGQVSEQKNPFYGFIAQRIDENQDYSPCCVWLNKKYGYNARGEYAFLTEENYNDYNFPAPLSVGIFFDVEPEDWHIETIKERSVKFFDQIWSKICPDKKTIEVEGFRLIVHTKYGHEIDL